MKVVYMGTPQFAIPSLQKLHESSHQVVAVVSGPDQPVGRGRKLASPAVKALARELGYLVLQPPSLKDHPFQTQLKDLSAHVFVVVAFKILPDSLLAIPPGGAVNLHPSLLPKYRGAAPLQHCLINGDSVTGVTTIALTHQVDSGDILLQREYTIDPQEDLGILTSRMAQLGGDLVVETLDGLENQTITPHPQGELAVGEPATAPKIVPADQIIHWNRPAQAIANQTRALTPRPGAYTHVDGQRLKLFNTTATTGGGEPGVVVAVDRDQLVVGTGRGRLAVKELQLEGRRRMPVGEFRQGGNLEPGLLLG